MVSTVANACGGITVKGNSGTSYCLSKHKMNWYSAYAWCNDQKMSLIDLETVCKSSKSCPELNLSSEEKTHITDNGGSVNRVWTNISHSSYDAFYVDLRSGYIGAGVYRYDVSYYALCF